MLLYSRVSQNTGTCSGVGLGINVDQKWKNCIKPYTLVNDIITLVTFKINRGSLCVVDVYGPENGKEEESDLLYAEFQKQLHNM